MGQGWDCVKENFTSINECTTVDSLITHSIQDI